MVNLNVGLTSILVLVGVVALITIFPTNLCLPFSDICLFLTPLHTLKKIIAFGIGLFLFYGWWVAIIYLFGRGIYVLAKYPFVKHSLMFLVTFSDENWQGLKNSINPKNVK